MKSKVIENVFFFGLLGVAAYLVWLVLFPFMSALVLSAIIATVCFPLYDRIRSIFPGGYDALASLLSTLVVFLIVIIPISLLAYLLFVEATSFYASMKDGTQITSNESIALLEESVRKVVPDFSFNLNTYAKDAAAWVVSSIGVLFASTASTAFLLFIAFVGLYYLFKDGRSLAKVLIHLSPLPDSADEKIIIRLTQSIRSVVLGKLTVSIIQGVLVAVGFGVVGIPQAILWGCVAAVAALIPAIGTALVILPAVAILYFSGSYMYAGGLLLWGIGVVGLVDNLLGPYLMKRGTELHPFLVLITAIGGIAYFGPLGFILGPVIMSFFMALLEIYRSYIARS